VHRDMQMRHVGRAGCPNMACMGGSAMPACGVEVEVQAVVARLVEQWSACMRYRHAVVHAVDTRVGEGRRPADNAHVCGAHDLSIFVLQDRWGSLARSWPVYGSRKDVDIGQHE